MGQTSTWTCFSGHVSTTADVPPTLIQCDHVDFPVLEQLPGFHEEWCSPPSPYDIATPDTLSNSRAETLTRVLAVVLVVSLVP
jgi:hypothetical protein